MVEQAVVVVLNEQQFRRLQRRARQEGVGTSEMVTKVMLEWRKRQTE